MTAPAPLPPWARPIQSPLVQIIVGADNVNLGVDTTYLQQTTQQSGNAPYVVVLPNGNFQRQYHTLIVPGNLSPTTAPFKITGTFNGFVTLLFSSSAVCAQLVWDGTAWNLIGGSASPSQSS
jgi:hypothetical protein